MERVLKTIAKQANLDRILFTPGLKKMYFEMAVASGGATQFKHADTIRNGLTFIADKADDKKHALLFCSASELIHGYDLLLRYAAELLPTAVLAVREGGAAGENWSIQNLSQCGWVQFHTHTLQEVYDHLALAYLMFEEKKVRLPVLILHSGLSHASLGSFTAQEHLNLGNPLTGLQTSRVEKKMDFETALAAVKKKKEKPSLSGSYKGIVSLLRESYSALGYTVPDEGLPYKGRVPEGETATISLIPAAEESDGAPVRLLCYRPFSVKSLIPAVSGKKTIAVVEPKPSPGVAVPPFYAEIRCSLDPDFAGKVISISAYHGAGTLSTRETERIQRILEEATSDPKQYKTFYELGES